MMAYSRCTAPPTVLTWPSRLSGLFCSSSWFPLSVWCQRGQTGSPVLEWNYSPPPSALSFRQAWVIVKLPSFVLFLLWGRLDILMHLELFLCAFVCIHCISARCVRVFQSVHLSRLDVCNVPMVDYPAQSLSKALLTSRLTVLHLHNAQLSGMPLYALGMAYTIHTHTHTIFPHWTLQNSDFWILTHDAPCWFVKSFSCVDCEHKFMCAYMHL